tara:strand:- start:992 stop:1315 length:324 start_codon:yes stop_codon:yes gene_type:complete
MKRKRKSKRVQNIFQSIVFFGSTILVISCLIIYLWVYTEIDETLLYTEIQTATVKELENEIYEMKNSIESLNRADAIAKRAKRELNMVFTDPETLNIFFNQNIHDIF